MDSASDMLSFIRDEANEFLVKLKDTRSDIHIKRYRIAHTMKSLQTESNRFEAPGADIQSLRKARRYHRQHSEMLVQLDAYSEIIRRQIRGMETALVDLVG